MNGLLILRAALAIALYAFLGVVVYVIWRGLARNASERTPAFQAAHLTLESESAPAQVFELRPVTAIGRASDNHLPIDDPFASANHALFTWREDRWWIEDLDSHNGTYLNDKRLAKPTALTPGDRIRIGSTVMRFEMSECRPGEGG